MRPHLNFRGGQVMLRQDAAHPGNSLDSEDDRNAPKHNPLFEQNVAMQSDRAAITSTPAWEPYHEYFRASGTLCILAVPLFAAKTFSAPSLRSSTREEHSPEDIEFAQAFANQAAIAQEREAAAKARAEKFAAADGLLRESAERLGAVEDIDEFLGEVLITITQIFGETSATVWVADLTANTAHLTYVIEAGTAIQPLYFGTLTGLSDPL